MILKPSGARRYFWFGGGGRSNLMGPKGLVFWVTLASAQVVTPFPGETLQPHSGAWGAITSTSAGPPPPEPQSGPTRPRFPSPSASVGLPACPPPSAQPHGACYCLGRSRCPGNLAPVLCEPGGNP